MKTEYEVGITNGLGEWVVLMGEFATRREAELWRTRSYLRGNPANIEIREVQKASLRQLLR